MAASDHLSRQQFGYEIGHEEMPRDYEDDPRRIAAWATHAGKPIGQGIFTVRQSRLVMDSDLFVEPSHRRKGVASAMLNHMESSFPEHKIEPNGFTGAGLEFWRNRK